MSNLPRRLEEYPVLLTGALSPTTIIIPVATDIRLLDSTTTPLLTSASYTGGSLSVRNYKYICGTCFADQPGTLYIDFASDGTNWDGRVANGYVANQQMTFHILNVAQTARIVFANGALGNQTVFRLYAHGKLS